MLKVTSGRNYIQFAKQFSKLIGIEYIEADIKNFADGELRVEFINQLPKELLIVQSIAKPANDNLMELLLLTDAAKRGGVKNITALVPYLGYSRQDRLSSNYGAISAKVVAKMLETAGITKLITVDLHSAQIAGFYDIRVQNIGAIPLFKEKIATGINSRDNLLIVSPDAGGRARAQALAALLGTEAISINKIRDNYNSCYVTQLTEDVTGKTCIIIDDILDTGQSLCKAAEMLMQCKAYAVEAYITHAVLSRTAMDDITQSCIKRVTVTDSIIYSKLPKKFEVISLMPLLTKLTY